MRFDRWVAQGGWSIKYPGYRLGRQECRARARVRRCALRNKDEIRGPSKRSERISVSKPRLDNGGAMKTALLKSDVPV